MNLTDLFNIVILMLIIALVVSTSAIAGYFTGYESGQIDCINGKIKYELKVQPDGASAWTHKQGE